MYEFHRFGKSRGTDRWSAISIVIVTVPKLLIASLQALVVMLEGARFPLIHRHQPISCGSGPPPKIHQLSRPSTAQEKSEKLLPRHHKNTTNRPGIHKTTSAKSCFLRYLPYEEQSFKSSRCPDFNTWKEARKESGISSLSAQTNLKTGSPNRSQINENLFLDPHVSSLLIPWSSRVAHGCYNGPLGFQNGSNKIPK